jgi:hypothetical protein
MGISTERALSYIVLVVFIWAIIIGVDILKTPCQNEGFQGFQTLISFIVFAPILALAFLNYANAKNNEHGVPKSKTFASCCLALVVAMVLFSLHCKSLCTREQKSKNAINSNLSP